MNLQPIRQSVQANDRVPNEVHQIALMHLLDAC